MPARRIQAVDLAAARVRSPRGNRIVEAAAYAGSARLDDGARLRSPRSCRLESPAPWLTFEQNELLAQQDEAAGAAGGSPSDPQAAVDARAGWAAIRILAALLPGGWG